MPRLRYFVAAAGMVVMSAGAFAQPAPRLMLYPDTPRGHSADPLPGTQFPETQRRKLLIAHLDRSLGGQTVEVEVRAVRTTLPGPEVAYAGRGPVAADGRLPISVQIQRTWPVGHYAVSIAAGGQEIANLPYRVVAEPPRIGAITVDRFEVERRLGPDRFEAAAPPRAADRHLNIIARTRGARTDGAKVTWVFYAVETAAGSAEVTRFEVADRPLEDTILQFDVSLPRDWPVGRYRIDLHVDDRRVGAHEFRIEP